MRAPVRLSRIGPLARSPTARSIALGHRRWQRDQDDLGAFTADPQDPVSVLLAQVGDPGGAGFEDS
jgi:hypothetical protein